MTQKIRYLETKPIQQTMDFENKAKWSEFFNKRVQEIMNYTFPKGINFYDYFVYERVLLNKDGTPRKQINPTWLHTEKANKKQKKNWAEWVEKRKKQTSETTYRRKRAELQSKIEFYTNQLIELGKEHDK